MQTFESGYVSTLAAKLNPSDTTMTVAVAPTVTKGRLFLKSGSTKEWIKFTGVSGTTLTGLVRGLSKTADPSVAGTGLTWVAGTQITLVEMHDQMSDKQEGMPAKVYETTAARDADITSPSNGMQGAYVTADGTFYDYVAGAWTARANGTNVNASETVAGRVEKGTTAQSITPVDIGETGAYTFVSPSDIAKNTQSGTFVYGVDAGGDDTYVVALNPVLTAYTTGQTLTFTPTTANTGACSVNFGPSVLNIKTKDGNDPQTGVIRALTRVSGTYDGTNFVIDNEDFATAGNKGLSEMLTDEEATTGTDETRYPNAKQMKDNYLGVTDTILLTRDLSAASGTVAYNHGLGKVPKQIIFQLITTGSAAVGTSSGSYSSTTNVNKAVALPIDSGNALTSTSLCIIASNAAASASNNCAVSATSTTDFTLNWTKTGSPTGTYNIIAHLSA